MNGGFFDPDHLHKEIDRFSKEASEPRLWDDQKRARYITQKLAFLQRQLERFEGLRHDIETLLSLAQSADLEGQLTMKEELGDELHRLRETFEELEYGRIFAGKYDEGDAILALHAGTGGTDAQDWTAMLLRMYLRYAEKKGFATTIISTTEGSEAGIKKIVVAVEGLYAYGYLKAEIGVHRLVRISPFDAEKMRHTSFALVEVVPDFGDLEEIHIKREEIKVDVFRASGHGGQSVNTTDSAVRISHLPTGIIVTCQNERSQYQNRDRAMRYLKAKLRAYYMAEREEEKQRLRGEFSAITWGSQIRSYVLHPYKLVKDHRTGMETPAVERVLDGDLDDFIKAYLRGQRHGTTASLEGG